MTGLIADIGGTNARFAFIDEGGTATSPLRLACSDFPSLQDACETYLDRTGISSRPKVAAFAVASPITGDEIKMTNHVWSFSIEDTRRRLQLDSLDVVNDFIAIALGVPRLTAADLTKIGPGEVVPHSTIGVLGPGTGLGMAALAPTGLGWTPLASEGGHVTMPAADDREYAVLSWLRAKKGHVSAERLISGPGLVNIYHALAEMDGRPVDHDITPPDCTKRAVEASCPICVEALAMFSAMLGTIAGNLALTLNARGGVYIAGGIVPQLGAVFYNSSFRQRFEDKGRFRSHLAAIPTFAIIHPQPAFVGLASLVSGR